MIFLHMPEHVHRTTLCCYSWSDSSFLHTNLSIKMFVLQNLIKSGCCMDDHKPHLSVSLTTIKLISNERVGFDLIHLRKTLLNVQLMIQTK